MQLASLVPPRARVASADATQNQKEADAENGFCGPDLKSSSGLRRSIAAKPDAGAAESPEAEGPPPCEPFNAGGNASTTGADGLASSGNNNGGGGGASGRPGNAGAGGANYAVAGGTATANSGVTPGGSTDLNYLGTAGQGGTGNASDGTAGEIYYNF